MSAGILRLGLQRLQMPSCSCAYKLPPFSLGSLLRLHHLKVSAQCDIRPRFSALQELRRHRTRRLCACRERFGVRRADISSIDVTTSARREEESTSRLRWNIYRLCTPIMYPLPTKGATCSASIGHSHRMLYAAMTCRPRGGKLRGSLRYILNNVSCCDRACARPCCDDACAGRSSKGGVEA
jgi:hypothetical protein